MRNKLADENREILGVEGLSEATEDFELKNGWLLAACMIPLKEVSCLIIVLNPTDAPLSAYNKTKLGSCSGNKQNLFVNGIFTNQNKTKTLEKFEKIRNFGRLKSK